MMKNSTKEELKRDLYKSLYLYFNIHYEEIESDLAYLIHSILLNNSDENDSYKIFKMFMINLDQLKGRDFLRNVDLALIQFSIKNNILKSSDNFKEIVEITLKGYNKSDED